MKKSYEYWCFEDNLEDIENLMNSHTGITIRRINPSKNESIWKHVWRTGYGAVKEMLITPENEEGMIKLELDLDPQSFYNSPELFIEIYKEKLKNNEEI